MLMHLGLLLFMFYNYSAIGFQGLLAYGAFLFFGIFSYTLLMDGNPYAKYLELFRALLGVTFIGITGNWFGLNQVIPYGSYLILFYFLGSAWGALYFTRTRILGRLKKTI